MLVALAVTACLSPTRAGEFQAQPGHGGPRSTTASPGVGPQPAVASAPAGGNWAQALVFSGDVAGTMSQVLDDPVHQSECTGHNSRFEEVWVSSLYGPVGDHVYQVLVRVPIYRGPGTYHAPDATIQVARVDRLYIWQTSGADTAAFTVDPGEETGSIDATLTELHTDATKLKLTGRWSCVT